MKQNITILLGCFYVLLTADLHATRPEKRMYKDAVSMGMGGVGVSTIGYSFSAIHNPAALGLMTDHDIAPFLSLGIAMNPEMFSVLKNIGNISSDETSFHSIDYDSLVNKAPSIGINGPLNVGYMGKGFGFWTTTSADTQIAIIDNPNNILSKNGINASMNSLVATGSELLKFGNKISIDQAVEIVKKYLGKDFLNAGLTDKDIEKFATELQKNPDLVKTLIPKAKFDATAEITVNVAYGYRIPFASMDKVSGLSLGATLRFSQRFKVSSGDDFVSVDQLGDSFSNISSQIYQAGSISSDFGAALRLENFIFGLSVRDAFSTGYRWKNTDGTSGGIENSKIPLSLDFGASYRFYFSNNFIQEVGMYLEFEDVVNTYDSWINKMRVGTEVKLFNFLDLRVGVYDSFITTGIGVGWKWFRMDLAYYRDSYYGNLFVNDQLYLNMTVGLDNSPQRKAYSLKQQQQHDRIQLEASSLINDSLKGIDNHLVL